MQARTGVRIFQLTLVASTHPPHLLRYGKSVRNLETNTQEELAKEAEAGRRGGLVLMGPAIIPQDLQFLVVYIFSAQDLPGFSAVGTPAVNAVVQVRLQLVFLFSQQCPENGEAGAQAKGVRRSSRQSRFIDTRLS